jgi:isocitrate dehydrogenase
MFEAIHGSAPRRAGQNLANPSGLFLGSILMLLHIGQNEVAEKAHNAWLCTLEEGIHTYDIFKEGISKEKVGTKEFAKAVVERLGKKPRQLKEVSYQNARAKLNTVPPYVRPTEKRELVGVDIFLEYTKGTPEELGALLLPSEGDHMKLEMIDNRGMAVWPNSIPGIFCSDSFRARFKLPDDSKETVSHESIIHLFERITASSLEFVKAELLYNFDGKAGFTRGQGQ